MNIGIDVQPLQTGTRHAGVGCYLRNMLGQLAELDSKNRYVLFANNADYLEPIKLPSETWGIYPVLRKPVLGRFWWWWDSLYLPFVLSRQEVDVYHYNSLSELEPMAPPLPFGTQGFVATIHDLIPLRLPELYPEYVKKSYWNFNFSAKLRRLKSADAIMTVSECSKRDIIELLGYPEEKITVIYNGIAPEFSQKPSTEELERIKKIYNLPDSFILYLGGYYSPRKNLKRLLDAYMLLQQDFACLPKLVLAGLSNSAHISQMHSLLTEKKLAESVFCLPHIPDKELPLLYRLAQLFVYPSLYEGFGLPVAEAMACGTVVATSHGSSLPEIGGDACLYFDPLDIQSIAEGIHKGLTNLPLRERLCSKGPKRSRAFSWKQSAYQLQKVYQQVGEKTTTR